MTILESLLKCQCSNCQQVQLISQGDPEDCTAQDADAVRCCACGHVELIGDEDWFLSMYVELDENDEHPPLTKELIEEHAVIQTGFKSINC